MTLVPDVLAAQAMCIGLHSGTVYMGLVTSHFSQLFIDYMRHTVLAGHLGTNNTKIPVSLILCSQTNLCCTGSFVLPSISAIGSFLRDGLTSVQRRQDCLAVVVHVEACGVCASTK